MGILEPNCKVSELFQPFGRLGANLKPGSIKPRALGCKAKHNHHLSQHTGAVKCLVKHGMRHMEVQLQHKLHNLALCPLEVSMHALIHATTTASAGCLLHCSEWLPGS